MPLATMGDMLKICNDRLPENPVSYAAFRLACADTLERMVLAEQLGLGDQGFGYLAEVPFLKQVPPHVQLDVLVESWHRHNSADEWDATLVDESVVYAACEVASRIVISETATALRLLSEGPEEWNRPVDLPLAKSIQSLHLDLANDGDFLLISQFLDIPPDESRVLKARFGLREAACAPLFDLLGRWHIHDDFAARAEGLLTPSELTTAYELFGVLGSSRIVP